MTGFIVVIFIAEYKALQAKPAGIEKIAVKMPETGRIFQATIPFFPE
jgi:hypothetical protein